MDKIQLSPHAKTWSVSRLKSYMSCPRKYFFKYKLFLPEDKKFYLTRGIIFHSIIAKYLTSLYENNRRAKLFTMSSSKDELDNYIEAISKEFEIKKNEGEPVSDAKHTEKSVLLLVQNAFDNFYSTINELSKFKVLSFKEPGTKDVKPAVELEFKIPLVDLDTMNQIQDADINLYGFIDLISYDNINNLSVRDHKLHSKRYSPFELNVDLQLIVYGYVFKFLHKMDAFPELKDSLPEELTVGLNSFLISKGISTNLEFCNIKLNNAKINQALKTIIQIVKSESEANFYPIFSDQCNWLCPYSDICLKIQNGEQNINELQPVQKNSLGSIIENINKEELI